MRRLALFLGLVVVVSCSATYSVEVHAPYCPVSDSAKARADSVSVLCRIPDSLLVTR